MRVAIAQINSKPQFEDNLSKMDHYARQASSQGADVVIFPEASLMAFDGEVREYASEKSGEAHRALQELARELGLAIVAGSFELAADGRILNTLLVAGPDRALTKYHKIHLYDAFGYKESETIAAGEEPMSVPLAGTTAGLSICYDVRFPELYRTLAAGGASVLIVSASWADGPGKAAQWDLLTRARALDTGSWVVAVDQAIREPGTEGQPQPAPLGLGHSAVIAPNGEEVVRLGSAEELRVVELDPARASEVRTAIAVLDNARLHRNQSADSVG